MHAHVMFVRHSLMVVLEVKFPDSVMTVMVMI